MDKSYEENVRKRREQVAFWYSKGINRRAIAEKLGVSSVDIIHADITYLTRKGIITKREPSREEKVRKIEKRREKVIVLWEKGKGKKEIASELGETVSKINNDVRYLLRIGKIKPCKKELPRLTKRREKVASLYNDGRTIEEIAKELGVLDVTIKSDINYLKVKGVIKIDSEREPKILKGKKQNDVDGEKSHKPKGNLRVAQRKYYTMMIAYIMDFYKKGDIDSAIQYLETLAGEANFDEDTKEKLQEIMDMLQRKKGDSEEHFVINTTKKDDKTFSERVENLYYAKLSTQEIARILKSSVQEIEDKIAELKERGIIQEDKEARDDEEER